MCNLYRLQTARSEIAAYYEADDRWGADADKDYVSPAKPGPVVTATNSQRALREMRWGWPNPRNPKVTVQNVRNYASPFWRSALANPERRCLVPFTSFQEWSVEPNPTTGKKRPYWFSIPSRPIGTFAGVWRPSEAGDIFAFLTTGYGDEPGAAEGHVVGAIHPKAIPVILHDEDFDRWLSAPVEEALSLATAFPSQLIRLEE